MYRFFYDRAVSGDVLFVLIDPEKKVDRTETRDGVTALYADGKLVGINLFGISATVKIQAKGMIAAPSPLLVDAVNLLLAKANLSPLPYVTDSGYVVAIVSALEEHPLDEKAKLVTLQSGTDTFSTVSWYPNLGIGSHVVIERDGAIGVDGSVFHKTISRNIPVDVSICSAKDLRIEGPAEVAFLALDETSGDDFFLGGH